MSNPEIKGIDFYVLDASVWVSRLVEQDEMHSTVRGWMDDQRANGAQFISPTLLLAEVGEALTRACLERAEQAGCPPVMLTSNPGRTAANRLYKRMGFELRKMNVYRYSFKRG